MNPSDSNEMLKEEIRILKRLIVKLEALQREFPGQSKLADQKDSPPVAGDPGILSQQHCSLEVTP